MPNQPIRCLASEQDVCGEGVLWHAEQQAVYWTDINRGLLHRYSPSVPSSQPVDTWHFDQPVTALTQTSDPDLLLVVLGGAVVLWNPERGIVRTLHRLPAWPHVRCNDARVSPSGTLWFGTMQNNVSSSGQTQEIDEDCGEMLRLRGDGDLSRFEGGFMIPNTVAWTPDAHSLFFGDTLRNAIYRYAYDLEGDAVTSRTIFTSGFSRGLPDGSAVDSEGCLWNCRYGGGCIVRFGTNGEVRTVLDLPMQNPTTCAFGGPSLRTLFVTSAHDGLVAPSAMEGGLFAIDLDVPGLPEPRFQLSNRTGSDPSKPPSTR